MGEENSSEMIPLEQRWEEISIMINEYLSKIGAKIKKPENIEAILCMSYDELRRLGHEECGENSFILAQYAYFIQEEYNYHKSKVDWCEYTLTYIVANYGEQSSFMNKEKKEERVSKLAFSNKSVKIIMKMLSTAKTVMQNLEGLSFKISSMADTMKNLQQSKRRING
jgi:hypothetical protein